MSKAARAANAQSGFEEVAVTGQTITIAAGTGSALLTASTGTSVDVINSQWIRGRRIFVKCSAGSSTVTFRDNQSGTNLVLIDLTSAVAADSSTAFVADLDASGNEMWVQCQTVSAIS